MNKQLSILPAHERTRTTAEAEGSFRERQGYVIIVEDDLIASPSLVISWGRKRGDRIIAEVVVYLDLGMLKIR